jgi:hypothetical protein
LEKLPRLFLPLHIGLLGGSGGGIAVRPLSRAQ